MISSFILFSTADIIIVNIDVHGPQSGGIDDIIETGRRCVDDSVDGCSGHSLKSGKKGFIPSG